jgi:hypothetical protein
MFDGNAYLAMLVRATIEGEGVNAPDSQRAAAAAIPGEWNLARNGRPGSCAGAA